MSGTHAKSFCCTSWRGLCYWGAAFLILYAIGLGLAIWLHAQAYQLAVLFAALGLACIANFARNRTFHCVITGPFFLLVALAVALEKSGVWKVGMGFVWVIVAVVVAVALVLERRFAS